MGEKAEARPQRKEEMVRKLARVLVRRGFDEMRVSGPEEFAGRRPPLIHWEGADDRFVPDIMARRKGLEYLFQIETAASLYEAAAAEKIALFSAFASHYRLQFCLLVPASGRPYALQRLIDVQADERFNRLITLEEGPP